MGRVEKARGWRLPMFDPQLGLALLVAQLPPDGERCTNHEHRERETTRVWRALPARIGGVEVGAMRSAASSHVAAVLDLLRNGEIAGHGLVAQEDLPTAALLASPFLGWLRQPTDGTAVVDSYR